MPSPQSLSKRTELQQSVSSERGLLRNSLHIPPIYLALGGKKRCSKSQYASVAKARPPHTRWEQQVQRFLGKRRPSRLFRGMSGHHFAYVNENIKIHALATSTGYAGRRPLPWLACNVARASGFLRDHSLLGSNVNVMSV